MCKIGREGKSHGGLGLAGLNYETSKPSVADKANTALALALAGGMSCARLRHIAEPGFAGRLLIWGF